MATALHHELQCMPGFTASEEEREPRRRSGPPATSVSDEKMNAHQAKVEEALRLKAELRDTRWIFAFLIEGDAASDRASCTLDWMTDALRPDLENQRAGCSLDFFFKEKVRPLIRRLRGSSCNR